MSASRSGHSYDSDEELERSDHKHKSTAKGPPPPPESAQPSSHKRRGRDTDRSSSRKKRKRVRRKQLATKKKERRKRKRGTSQIKVDAITIDDNDNNDDAAAQPMMDVSSPVKPAVKNNEPFLTARRWMSPSKARGARHAAVLRKAAQNARNVAQNKATVVRMEYWATFSAAHRVNTSRINSQANEHLYGQCNNFHGHNYHLRITLKGLIDHVTGMLYSHANLAVLVQEYVLDFVDHTSLENDLAIFFAPDVPSTTENLAILIYHLVEQGLGDEAHLLHSVFVGETKSLGSVYEGEEAVVGDDEYSS